MSSTSFYLRFRDIYDLMGRKCHPIVAWSVLRSCQEVSWLWLLNFELFMPSKLWYADTLVFLYLEVSLQKGVLLQWSMIQFSFCVLHPFWEYLTAAERIDRVPSWTDSVLHQDLVWFVMSQISKLRQCCITLYPPESWTRTDQNLTKRLISIETLVSDNDVTHQLCLLDSNTPELVSFLIHLRQVNQSWSSFTLSVAIQPKLSTCNVRGTQRCSDVILISY